MRGTGIGFLFILLAAAADAEPWKRHTIDDSLAGADGVRLADVNGDGFADISTGWEESGVIRVYVNPGPKKVKRCWPAVTVGKVASPEDAVFVDLDGDGAVDVVSGCEGNNRTVYIHWAPKGRLRYLDSEAWKTESIPVTRKKQLWMFALPMQVDGHDGIDLIVGSKGSGAAVGWLASPKNPRQMDTWKFHRLYKAGWIMSLQAHDMDDDDDPDVLISDRRGPGRGVRWLENPGPKEAATGARWKEHRLGAHDREVMFLTAADLDQDGRRDVAVAVKGRGITWFRSTGDSSRPWTTHEIEMPAGCGTGKSVAVCDVDVDGRNDVIFSCEHATGGESGLRWLSYNKAPTDATWQDHEISGLEGVKFDRIELLDLDRDGDLDVITCEEVDQLGVIWYENPCIMN